MRKIPESELILNPDGSIYHLHIRPENLADTVILVGDPGRVSMVSKYFDSIEFRMANREIHTHTGTLNKKRLTVMSTGMGTDNIDIVVNELDALVNVDLESRTEKEEKQSLNLIRIGTSGALQADIPVNSFVLSSHGLGFDGLLHYYDKGAEVIENQITRAFIEHAQWPAKPPSPYIVEGSASLRNKLSEGVFIGITATASGFYGPQGRQLRLLPSLPELNETMEEFSFGEHRITNFEMETSALFGLSKMLGHNAATLCAIIANRPAATYSKNYKETVERLVQQCLEKLTQ